MVGVRWTRQEFVAQGRSSSRKAGVRRARQKSLRRAGFPFPIFFPLPVPHASNILAHSCIQRRSFDLMPSADSTLVDAFIPETSPRYATTINYTELKEACGCPERGTAPSMSIFLPSSNDVDICLLFRHRLQCSK